MEKSTTNKTKRIRMSAEERLEAITQAVIPVFAKKGFAATTTKDLAQAADVSEALLYRHFPSKEYLYDYIQEQICSRDSSIHEFVYSLETGAEGIVKLVYILFKILSETPNKHPMGNSVLRLLTQSMLEDGNFARSFDEPRFKLMLPFFNDFAEKAIAAGEMVAGPISHNERQWFSHHLAFSLRLAGLPADPVFDYGTDPKERQQHGIWFCLRGMGLKDEVIERYLKPEILDPVIEDVLVRAGLWTAPQKLEI